MKTRTARLLRALLLGAILAGCGSTSPSAAPQASAATPPPSGAPGLSSFEVLVANQRAFDGRQVTVMGSLVEIGGTRILCAAVAEVFPDGCSVARLVLVGPVPAALMGQTVTVTGIFRAERGPAAMQLEVVEVRPTGA